MEQPDKKNSGKQKRDYAPQVVSDIEEHMRTGEQHLPWKSQSNAKMKGKGQNYKKKRKQYKMGL